MSKLYGKFLQLTSTPRSILKYPMQRFLFKRAPLQLQDLLNISFPAALNANDLLVKMQETKNEQISAGGKIFPTYYDSGNETVKLLQGLIGFYRPKVIVETGIGNGVSTRCILDAISLYSSKSGGTLHSLDVDIRTRTEELLGYSNWQFHHVLGRETLKDILATFGPIDFFYHDSDHSFDSQYYEYELAYSSLKKGGLLISDDINWSNAFLSFCNNMQLKPFVLADGVKFVGVVIKV